MLGISGWESVPAPQAGAGTGSAGSRTACRSRARPTVVCRHVAPSHFCATPSHFCVTRRISASPCARLLQSSACARSCPSSPRPEHRREQSFVNLKPPACSACQGGNPCPRQRQGSGIGAIGWTAMGLRWWCRGRPYALGTPERLDRFGNLLFLCGGLAGFRREVTHVGGRVDPSPCAPARGGARRSGSAPSAVVHPTSVESLKPTLS